MASHPIKVLIVDDSMVASELLAYIINSDPDLKVIGCVENGEKALEFIRHNKPDVITMDIIMPKMDGFEATRRIMATTPIPIIIVSSIYKKENVEKSFQAMEAGAIEILEKPRGFQDPYYQDLATSLVKTIKIVAGTKLVTRKFVTSGEKSVHEATPRTNHQDSSWTGKAEVVAIGSSLGGPQALNTIFSGLSSSFPVPILVVQHISSGFTQGFVDWLSESCSLEISLAKNKEIALPGHVYVAPDNVHLEIDKKNVMHLVDAPPEAGLRPAASRLFRSVANVFGSNGIGIILTGMGRDGVEDLLLLKQKGGMTIAQSQESCLMYGMPKEAIAIGAARQVVHLDQIANTLKKLVSKYPN